MANGGFLLGLHSNIDNIYIETGSTENIDRLIKGVPSETCTITPDTGVTEIVIKFKDILDIESIGIINHSIPSGATIKTKFSDNGLDWSSPVTISWNETNFYKCFSANNKYMMFRVETSQDFEVGELFPGTKFQFPENWDYEYIPGFVVKKNVIDVNGQLFEAPISEHRTFTMPFKRQSIDNWEDFANLYRPGAKIFVPDFDQLTCHHGHIPGKEYKPKRGEGDVDTHELFFSESAILGKVA